MNEIQKRDIDMRIVEISQSDFQHKSQATNPNGRRYLKMVLHEIYPDTSYWNENGITYLEQYTRDNAESVKGMPLCAQFLDDSKKTPYGHGMTGRIKNMPTFENSIQVGCFDNWSIEDLEIKGRVRRCLCATGYLNEARYPRFVKWILDKVNNGEEICGSVEFVGTKENDGEIIYDGGWKEKGRIPMVYDYSGYCILSITPSDSAAVLVELNQVNKEAMNFNKEVSTMVELNEEMKAVVSELKTEILAAMHDSNVAELNSQIEEKDSKIDELNQKIDALSADIEAKTTEIADLNEKVATAEKATIDKEAELNAKIDEINADKEKVVEELNELKKANKIAELNSALSAYTEDQKAYAKEEIEKFNADPFSVEINSIVEKIDATSYRKMREANEAKRIAETNSKNEFDDIIANIDPIINDKKEVEDFDVFA